MKVLEMEFLEGVRKPGVGGAQGPMDQKFRAADGALVTARLAGPGVVMERADSPNATFVPWTNIRFAVVERATVEEPKKKAAL